MRIVLATLAVVCLTVAVPAAQWINLEPRGIPRTPDGKPNLTAPAPKAADGRPDLSGVWRAASNRWVNNLAGDADVPMQPWAAAVYKERMDTLGAHKPQVRCLPHGVPDAMLVPNIPFKIIQTPTLTVTLHEEFNEFRQIFTDGRSLPVDPNPAWFGYSIGAWEGDTFVVTTAGFNNDGSWLDNNGHPHTDALRVTERFRRTSFGNMELEVAVDDPKAYTRPWKSEMIRFNIVLDSDLIEHLCENEKDAIHLERQR